MRPYDARAPLAFVHVPKSGGTSLRRVFAAWFGDQLHCHYGDPLTGEEPPLKELGPGSCLFGHFNKRKNRGIERRYPDVAQFVTVLRDPFDAMVSRYYYLHHVAADWLARPGALDQDLAEYLTTEPPTMMDHLPFELTLENYRALLNRHFVHLGVTERLTASLECLARKLGRRVPSDVPTLNVTERPREFEPALRADYRTRHPVAYAIYEFALEHHDRID